MYQSEGKSMTNTLKKDKKRKMLVLTFGALIYALLFALGSQIEQSGSTAFSQTLLRFTAAFPAALFLLWVIFEKCRFQAKEKREKPFCGVLKAGAFLLLCDLPMFLIEYPGSFAYDSYQQALQVSTGQYSTFHPLLYTMLLRAGIAAYSWLQSLEKCMALVIVIQMVLTALCFALTCDSLARSCSPRAARWALAVSHGVFLQLYERHAVFRIFDVVFCADAGRTESETREFSADRGRNPLRRAGLFIAQQHDLCDAGLECAASVYQTARSENRVLRAGRLRGEHGRECGDGFYPACGRRKHARNAERSGAAACAGLQAFAGKF